MIYPIRTAGGEEFSSVEDMLKSENKYNRGLAKALIKNRDILEEKVADFMNKEFEKLAK